MYDGCQLMILATIFLLLLAYPVYQFGLRGVTEPQAIRKYVPAFVVFGVLLLLTAAFAFNERLEALAPGDLPPLRTTEALRAQATDPQTDVLVLGAVGELQNGVTISTRPQTRFPLVLEGGSVSVLLGENVLALSWPRQGDRRVLEAGQPLVVVGSLQAADDVEADIDTALDRRYLVAETVYAGDITGYLDLLPRFALIPTMTALLSVILGMLLPLVPLLKWHNLRKRAS
jgi:hypothetical protein